MAKPGGGTRRKTAIGKAPFGRGSGFWVHLAGAPPKEEEEGWEGVLGGLG